jgi:hypothetical protein
MALSANIGKPLNSEVIEVPSNGRRANPERLGKSRDGGFAALLEEV